MASQFEEAHVSFALGKKEPSSQVSANQQPPDPFSCTAGKPAALKGFNPPPSPKVLDTPASLLRARTDGQLVSKMLY